MEKEPPEGRIQCQNGTRLDRIGARASREARQPGAAELRGSPEGAAEGQATAKRSVAWRLRSNLAILRLSILGLC